MSRVPVLVLLTATCFGLVVWIILPWNPVEKRESLQTEKVASKSCILGRSAPDDFVKSLITCVQSLNDDPSKSDSHLATDMVQSVIAEDFLASRVLGNNKNAVDAPSLATFRNGMSVLVGRSIVKNIAHIDIRKTSPFEVKFGNDASMASVSFSVNSENPAHYLTDVGFRLVKQAGASDWKIYDAVFENIGLVANYRNEIAKLIDSNGIDYAIKKVVAKSRT